MFKNHWILGTKESSVQENPTGLVSERKIYSCGYRNFQLFMLADQVFTGDNKKSFSGGLGTEIPGNGKDHLCGLHNHQ